MHEVLVNPLGGLSLPRKSVVRLTDRPDMTLDVYRGHKTTIQQQQPFKGGLAIDGLFCDSLYRWIFHESIIFVFFSSAWKSIQKNRHLQCYHRAQGHCQRLFFYRWTYNSWISNSIYNVMVHECSFRGNNSQFRFCFPSQCSQLIKERICSQRSKFFPLRVVPILKGACHPGKQSGSHNSCSRLLKWRKNMETFPSSLSYMDTLESKK